MPSLELLIWGFFIIITYYLTRKSTRNIYKFFLMFISEREGERERQCASRGGGEREGDTELKLAPGSELSTQSLTPGSNSRTREIVTWAEVSCPTNSASQAPLEIFINVIFVFFFFFLLNKRLFLLIGSPMGFYTLILIQVGLSSQISYLVMFFSHKSPLPK